MLDKKRLENGQIFDEEYFEHLPDEIIKSIAAERIFFEIRVMRKNGLGECN